MTLQYTLGFVWNRELALVAFLLSIGIVCIRRCYGCLHTVNLESSPVSTVMWDVLLYVLLLLMYKAFLANGLAEERQVGNLNRDIERVDKVKKMPDSPRGNKTYRK